MNVIFIKNIFYDFRVHDELFAVDGKKLFSMSKKELIEAFGKKEGTRLDAQVKKAHRIPQNSSSHLFKTKA